LAEVEFPGFRGQTVSFLLGTGVGGVGSVRGFLEIVLYEIFVHVPRLGLLTLDPTPFDGNLVKIFQY
jgi:hypothetical protein